MRRYKIHGLRGSALEEAINFSNAVYQENKLALIQKIPTPITPIDIDRESRQITLAYFERKSTVDYIGVVQGIAVCFDAKECKTNTFSLSNLHEHQIEFMKNFEEQGGVAFLILHYTHLDEMYYLPYQSLFVYWKRKQAGGRKSITYEEICKEYPIYPYREILVHYLEALNQYLVKQEKE